MNIITKNMKKLNISFLLCLFSLLTIVSCNSDDDDNNDAKPSSNIQATMEANVQNGTWRITKFIDSSVNETTHFTGYIFTFNSSGVLNANNGTNSYDGTWSITNDNNDDSPDDLDFNINFNLTNDFEDLNDDWDILSQTSVKIELIDVGDTAVETDYLTFEKN